MNIYHPVTRQQKPCLLFRTMCSIVLKTKLFEFLIYAKEEQRLCNFPLGGFIFSAVSPHQNTALARPWFYWARKITQQFIELRALMIKVPVLRSFLNPVAGLWGNAQSDGKGNFFSFHCSFLPSFLHHLFCCFFLPSPPPPFFFFLNEFTLQMRKRGETQNKREGIVKRFSGRDWRHMWCAKNSKTCAFIFYFF